MHDTGNNWLGFTSHDFSENVDKWNYVSDHLEGTVIDDKKISKYLHKRKQGESKDAYEERKNIVDYTPHFSRACLTLAGMLWAVDYDSTRTWTKVEGGEGLGDPKSDTTIMSRLWQNADGRGGNWQTVWKGGTVDVIAQRKIFVLVEGVRRDAEGNAIAEPSVRIIPPQAVPRTVYDDGRLVSVKVKTSVETQLSQKEKAEKEDRYLIFDEAGVETWREDDKGEPELVDKKFYGGTNKSFRYLDRDLRTPILPIFEVSIPLRANIGYIMARKANAIFNQENTLDFLLWVACFPKLFTDVKKADGSYDKDADEAIKKALVEGNNVIPGAGNTFAAPPTAPAQIKQKILENKVRSFFTTFFQAYGDAASERTATEIRQDFRAGVEAFLTLLGTTMDEAENAALWRLEQIHFPNNQDVWGGAHVSRSTDFQPIDIEQRIEKLIDRWILSGVPLDVETKLDIEVKALEAEGIPVTQERKGLIRNEIQKKHDRDEQENSLARSFGVAA